jgi:hypothetical protein
MARKPWTIVYKRRAARREQRDTSSYLFEGALGVAIQLQWDGAEICRILAPNGLPVPRERYAEIIWKRPCIKEPFGTEHRHGQLATNGRNEAARPSNKERAAIDV